MSLLQFNMGMKGVGGWGGAQINIVHLEGMLLLFCPTVKNVGGKALRLSWIKFSDWQV